MRIGANATVNGKHVHVEKDVFEGHSHVDTQRAIGMSLLFEAGLSNLHPDYSIWVDGALLHAMGKHQGLGTTTDEEGKAVPQVERAVDWTFGGTVESDWPPPLRPSAKLT